MCLNQIKFEVCMLCKIDHKFPKFIALTREQGHTSIQSIDFAPKKTPSLQDLADIFGAYQEIFAL